MIATDQFLFVHLHKSGGTFVNAFLDRFFATTYLGYHLPLSRCPPKLRKLPVIGVVRDPWSFYASWFTFQSDPSLRESLFQVVSAADPSFKATTTNLVTLGERPELLSRFQDQVPYHFVNHGINLTKQCVEQLRGDPLGFYSYLFRRMFDEREDVRILKLDHLRAELVDALRSIGVDVTEEMENYLQQSPKLNQTSHQSNRDLYDGELEQLVRERDAEIIEGFGFTF